MAEIKLSDQELHQIAKLTAEIVSQTIINRINRIERTPPLMTRKQFMEYANIGAAKCNELFHREDFPVTYELGHPRVKTDKLESWLDEDINNRKLINYPYPFSS